MQDLEKLAKLIRYYSLVSTTEAGSGHPTSSLSAADLMTVLMFNGHFKFDLENPGFENNDRLIFSKGHASPLFYSLWAAAGKVSEKEMLSLRKFGSRLEGHPTMEFPYTEVPTGSLGQGLSVGVGMALNAKLDGLSYRTFVLLGDSEMAEGSVWEAMASADHYHLNNLVAILDVNRLGQRGETMYGHNLDVYQKRAEAFGWKTIVIDGHDFDAINEAFSKAQPAVEPFMIIAKTLKGKGVSFIEDKDGWHGKALSADELKMALAELGEIDKNVVGQVAKPEKINLSLSPSPQEGRDAQDTPAEQGNATGSSLLLRREEGREVVFTNYQSDQKVATRKAYGNILPKILDAFPNAVVLDGEVSNSTFAETVKKTHPERFFEMYIAEQNMVGVATGMARRGKIPFISTFAAFFSRAFDQIRMSQYAQSNIKYVGSHAGVSIGEDGSSQMALEDIAMFRTMFGGAVLYPSDAVSTEKLVAEAAKHQGNVYIRTTRKDTPIIYNDNNNYNFKIGGSCVLRSSDSDRATVIGAGITLHEALAAYDELQKEGINIRVIDLYSIKPIDIATLQKAAQETKNIITVEDHFAEGGIGEAVASALAQVESGKYKVKSLAVSKMPKSGKPEELVKYAEIDSSAIIKKVKELI